MREYDESLGRPASAGPRPARPPSHRDDRLRLRTSTAAEDGRWDDFLARRDGHHTQTSLWGRVKSAMGWHPVRVLAERGDQVVGGAQILYRRIPVVGSVGYISAGPVAADHDDVLAARIMDEVESTARALRMRLLAVQPAGAGETWPPQLATRGYAPTGLAIAPRATLMLGVARDPDDILSAMTSKTRYNIRLSGRRSVLVRDGDASDLDTYHALLRATSERQGFTPYPKSYYVHMWQTLAPGGHIRLALADVDGRTVSGQLAIAFGNTVVNKMSVWSGEAGSRRPNEALQWSTIRWAHEQRYDWYDLEGLKPEAAHAVLRGEALPDSLRQSVSSYKLGFGGEVRLRPDVRMCITNPALRWAFPRAYPRLRNLTSINRFVRSSRKSEHGGSTENER